MAESRDPRESAQPRTTPLTPEEVAKLRLPEWFTLADNLPRNPRDTDAWKGCAKELGFAAPRHEVVLSYIAENVANGYLPPAALDAVWAVVEGKLEYYSYDQCGDLNRYDNEKDAADDAEDTFSEACADGWDDGVERIEYGMIIRLGGARDTGNTSKDEAGNTVTEYEMVVR